MSTGSGNPSVSINPQAVETLRKLLDKLRAKPPSSVPEDWNLAQMMAFKARVIPTYGPAFSPPAVAKLPQQTFLEFLQFKNNHHWRGLDRSGAAITKDMNRLRAALTLLVDESKPLTGSVGAASPDGGPKHGSLSRPCRAHGHPPRRLPGVVTAS